MKRDDDYDIWEAFKALKEKSREKKRINKVSSTDLLKRKGIPFESKNDGIHLIVRGKVEVVDFWPSTGKWIVRGTKAGNNSGRGVANLIKRLTESG